MNFINLTASPLYSATTGYNGWEIVRHSSICGIEEFYVTKNYIRIDNKMMHAIFKANTNMVDVFNKTTHKYAKVTINELADSLSAHKNSIDKKNPDKWIFKQKFKEKNVTISEYDGANNHLKVFVIKDVEIPDNLAMFFRKIFDFPKSNNFLYKVEDGYPVKSNKAKNNKSYYCYTISIKKVNLTPDDFVVPKNYKKVKTLGSMYIDDDIENLAKSMY